jgi:hypothetical protein
LPTPTVIDGWPDEQGVGAFVDEPQCGQLADQRFVDAGLSGEVEVRQCPGRGQTGEPEPGGQPTFFDRGGLDGQQLLEELDRSQLLDPGPVQQSGQGLGGGGEAQESQVRTQLLVALGLTHRGRRTHRLDRLLGCAALVSHWSAPCWVPRSLAAWLRAAWLRAACACWRRRSAVRLTESTRHNAVNRGWSSSWRLR